MNKNIIKNIFNTKSYLYLFVIIFFIIIIIPLIFKTMIIPSFKNLILSNGISQAKRVASHLIRTIDYDNLTIDEINLKMNTKLDKFKVKEVQYIDKNGFVVYSTIPNKIGTQNNNTHFKEIVSKGKEYFTIKQKIDKVAEDKKFINNIIEIYIPVMENFSFHSSLELYYDISEEINEFNKLSNFMIKINILISLFALFILYIITYLTSKRNLEDKRYQEKLTTLAHTDSLTNLFNRRYFFKIAEQLLILTERDNDPISIAMIDIDNFKKINDTYGHQIGDYVIKTLSKELVKLTRESDLVARYGGEEFIILFPNTNIKGIEIITKKICKHIEEFKLILNNIDFNFTISVGITEYKKDGELDDFIQQADNALYIAKKSGKNKVIKSH